MTTPELVRRVKNLPTDTSVIQVEKYVTELLGPPKRGELMVNLYKRKVLKKMRDLRS